MKKLISALLILVLVLTLSPINALAGVYDGLRSSKDKSTVEVEAKTETKTETKKAEADDDKTPSATQGIYLKASDDYDMPYVIKVDRVNQIVTIFEESDSGDYDVIVKQFICSTGTKKDPTPEGMFTLSDKSRKNWRYFKTYDVYVRYAVHIKGNYFFHSLLYNEPDVSTLSRTSYRNLGSPVSHGCIRMLDEDIKWMFKNCLAGTRVYVMDCEKDKKLHDSLMPEPLD